MSRIWKIFPAFTSIDIRSPLLLHCSSNSDHGSHARQFALGFGQVMAAPGTRPFWRNPDRRTFLWSLASLGLAAKMATSEKSPEPASRLLTPEGEVRMSVRYFASSTTDSFHFRDDLTKRVFCLTANGEERQGCLERFVGSMAIACYDFPPGIVPRRRSICGNGCRPSIRTTQ